MDPTGNLLLICKALWTLLRGSFNAYIRSSMCVSSDFTGRKPGNTQRDDSLLSLNDQMEWLGDSTELSRMGLSHCRLYFKGMAFLSEMFPVL
jgi:hypothetical protein